MNLITAKYSDDPERKRIEYVLEKWRGKLGITRPQGIIAIIAGDEIGELVEELYSRTSRDNVSIYRVEKTTVDIEKGKQEIRLKLDEKKETVAKLVGFLMAKQKAILKRETTDPFERTYGLTTKKGKAEISVTLKEETGDRIDLRMRITGYGEVVDFLYNKLSDELDYL